MHEEEEKKGILLYKWMVFKNAWQSLPTHSVSYTIIARHTSHASHQVPQFIQVISVMKIMESLPIMQLFEVVEESKEMHDNDYQINVINISPLSG
jgi:hypothetical protein